MSRENEPLTQEYIDKRKGMEPAPRYSAQDWLDHVDEPYHFHTCTSYLRAASIPCRETTPADCEKRILFAEINELQFHPDNFKNRNGGLLSNDEEVM